MRWKCTRVTYRTCRLRKMKTIDRRDGIDTSCIMPRCSPTNAALNVANEHKNRANTKTQRTRKRRNTERTETQGVLSDKRRERRQRSTRANGDLENGSSKMERGGRCTMHHISLLGLRSSPDPGSSLPALPNQQQQNNDTTLQLRAP